MSNLDIYLNEEDLLKKAKSANGHRVGEYNIANRDLSFANKGIIGQVIEEGLFGYQINSRAEPDFANLGIELKVTGIKQLKNKSYVPKERLVLNIIDYFKEADVDFEHSTFWNKNKNLLLMFYLYKEELTPDLYPIIDSILYKYPLEDLKIIKDDWKLINEKINKGEAHLISEADTMYLAACTKGANGEATRLQPFSTEKAKQRAFCLKNSYLKRIINEYLIGEKCDKIFSVNQIANTSFEMAVDSSLRKYIGMSENELREMFNVTSSAKNVFELLTSKMLNISGKVNNSDEFLKANIVSKTIRVEENGKIKESMSFPMFKFKDIIEETWEDSELRKIFFETKFMFVIFKKKNGKYFYNSVKFWNMPVELLDSKVFEVWKKTKEIIQNGNIVKGIKEQKNGKYILLTNFPGQSFNGVCHVRPHARNAEDSDLLPIADKMTGQAKFTKQCFWLNSTFIAEIIK